MKVLMDKSRLKRLIGRFALKALNRTGSMGLRDMGANEAVNFDLSAIFVAVPKTGTTSIRRQMMEARPFMVPTPHLNILELRKVIDLYFLIQSLEKNDAYPTRVDEVLTHAEAMQRAGDFYDKCFKFGSVRNPWARVASIYSRKEGIPQSSEMSFESFCDRLEFASDTCAKPSRHRNQVDWLTDDNGDLAVDYVMKLEERSAALQDIREMTGGRISFDDVNWNKNPDSKSRNYRDIYNDKTRDIVGRVFEKDVDVLKYAF